MIEIARRCFSRCHGSVNRLAALELRSAPRYHQPADRLNFLVRDLIDSRMISTDTRYAVISSVSTQDPSQCIDSTVVNLRDVTFIRTERVTLDQLAAEHRMAGIRSGSRSSFDDKLLKTLSQLKFV